MEEIKRYYMMANKFFVTLLCCTLCSTVLASPLIIPAAPQIAAKAYLLIDAESGEEIVSYNADEAIAPASLTKLMTSYVLSYELSQGNVSNSDSVLISKNAWAQNPLFAGSSLMWIEVNKQVSLKDLHKGVVISSGNDASVAVAEHLAGSESAFADVMNQHARRLGMRGSNFVNAHGLPHKDHFTTAKDLATLSKELIGFSEEYRLYSEKEFLYNGIKQTNRNRLLWRDTSVDGLKTGYTSEAGYCLVASAVRDGMRLISVVMGARNQDTREQETQKLLAYGFRYFETTQLYAAKTKVADAKIWAGKDSAIDLGVAKDIVMTIPRGSRERLEAVTKIDDVIKAPFSEGQSFGQLVVSLNGKVLEEVDLVALKSVEQAGIFSRLWASLVLFVLNLIGS